MGSSNEQYCFESYRGGQCPSPHTPISGMNRLNARAHWNFEKNLSNTHWNFKEPINWIRLTDPSLFQPQRILHYTVLVKTKFLDWHLFAQHTTESDEGKSATMHNKQKPEKKFQFQMCVYLKGKNQRFLKFFLHSLRVPFGDPPNK